MDRFVDMKLDIAQIKNLPTLPEESVLIINAVNNPDISIDELVKVISKSPSLTARLIGLANSAYFGRTVPVNDLRRAIIQVLGLNLVKSLALGIAINVELDTSKCDLFDPGFFWSHALITAYLAQKLSGHIESEMVSPNIVYTSGLLLNIGLLVAVHLVPAQMNDVFAQSEQADYSVSIQMRSNLGITQYEIGAFLLERWKLPLLYQTIVKEFRQSGFSGKEKVLIDILELSHRVGYYILTDKDKEMPDFSSYLNRLSISMNELDQLVLETVNNKDNINDLAAYFGE